MPIAINFGKKGMCNEELVPFHKVTRSFDHVVLQGHVYFSYCITFITRLMDAKLDKVVS